MDDLETLFADLGGVASVPDVAEFFGISQAWARDWATENAVPRAGNSFAFLLEHARALGDDLDEGCADEDADDDTDDDEDLGDEDDGEDGDECGDADD